VRRLQAAQQPDAQVELDYVAECRLGKVGQHRDNEGCWRVPALLRHLLIEDPAEYDPADKAPKCVDQSKKHHDHCESTEFARGVIETNRVADGRGAASADGKSFTKMPWSTPLTAYRGFGARRLMGSGEGIWHAPSGDYSYLRFVLDSIEYNVAAPRAAGHR
jgi:hypothetical protein